MCATRIGKKKENDLISALLNDDPRSVLDYIRLML